MNNANTTHTYMNNNDTDRERFAINASNNKEFLLGGPLAKARMRQSKEQKEEEEEEVKNKCHWHTGPKNVYYTNRNKFELKLWLQLLKSFYDLTFQVLGWCQVVPTENRWINSSL